MITSEDLTRWKYNCLDVHYTLEVALAQQKLIEKLPKNRKDFLDFQLKDRY